MLTGIFCEENAIVDRFKAALANASTQKEIEQAFKNAVTEVNASTEAAKMCLTTIRKNAFIFIDNSLQQKLITGIVAGQLKQQIDANIESGIESLNILKAQTADFLQDTKQQQQPPKKRQLKPCPCEKIDLTSTIEVVEAQIADEDSISKAKAETIKKAIENAFTQCGLQQSPEEAVQVVLQLIKDAEKKNQMVDAVTIGPFLQSIEH